jgi:6-phosphogluconolactonase
MMMINLHIPTKINKGVSMTLIRTFGAALLGSALASISAGAYVQAAQIDNTVPLYASLGEQLLHYAFNIKDGTLEKKGEPVILPANLQFAVPDPQGRFLYAVSSNAGSGTFGAKGDTHLLGAFRIDPRTGDLTAWGEPAKLPERPIHLTLDRNGEYALTAFNQSATLSVHRIAEDGSIGADVVQESTPQAGIFTHQVMVTPNNDTVVALGRGNDASADRPEDLGSINSFRFDQGRLTPMSQVEYSAGLGPRHLAFHPDKPWAYVAIERSSKLFMYPMADSGTLAPEPLYRVEALRDMTNEHRPRQKGGVLQFHPGGRFLYVANRSDGEKKVGEKTVLAGGENTMAVFRIDQDTGEPVLIQHVDTHGIEARTFDLDPSGKWLVVANQKSLWTEQGDELEWVPANFAVFSVAEDGKLTFVRKYDMDDAEGRWLLWMDIVPQARPIS